jgi:hypothetical protein
VKLRGRTEAPDGAEGAQFPSARGAKPQAHHGPLQRLLDRRIKTYALTSIHHRARPGDFHTPMRHEPRELQT